ncbi:MAG: hypothetical protein FWE54_04485 [Methanimicrococcus sp.]|nr:hypothetical protein [Methanimicrococcus sp.]
MCKKRRAGFQDCENGEQVSKDCENGAGRACEGAGRSKGGNSGGSSGGCSSGGSCATFAKRTAVTKKSRCM